jgi:hypothetical protein
MSGHKASSESATCLQLALQKGGNEAVPDNTWEFVLLGGKAPQQQIALTSLGDAELDAPLLALRTLGGKRCGAGDRKIHPARIELATCSALG